MIGGLIAAALASAWMLPACAGAVGALGTWIFAGDGQSALLAGLALGGAALAVRLLPPGIGRPLAALVLGAGALFLAQRRGERRGAATQIAKEKADAERAVEKAQRARADADRRHGDPERLRDDDGFRRD